MAMVRVQSSRHRPYTHHAALNHLIGLNAGQRALCSGGCGLLCDGGSIRLCSCQSHKSPAPRCGAAGHPAGVPAHREYNRLNRQQLSTSPRPHGTSHQSSPCSHPGPHSRGAGGLGLHRETKCVRTRLTILIELHLHSSDLADLHASHGGAVCCQHRCNLN